MRVAHVLRMDGHWNMVLRVERKQEKGNEKSWKQKRGMKKFGMKLETNVCGTGPP